MMKSTYKIIGAALLALWACAAPAGEVVVGQPLPQVVLGDGDGLLTYENGEHTYSRWDTGDLKGKVFMLYMVAARVGADKINEPLQIALKEAGGVEVFTKDQYSIVSILNMNAVFPMGGGFARKAFEHARTLPENDHADFVLDESGALWNAWSLKPKSSAIIIIDRDGTVLRFKDGALTEAEVTDYVELFKSLKQETANDDTQPE